MLCALPLSTYASDELACDDAGKFRTCRASAEALLGHSCDTGEDGPSKQWEKEEDSDIPEYGCFCLWRFPVLLTSVAACGYT